MTTLNLGIIGTGLAVEKLHWPALQRLGDRFKVVAYCDIDHDHARAFADYSFTDTSNFAADYQDLLARDDVDAVLISLPIPTVAQVLADALESGKHILCEKPQAATLAEADALWPIVRAHADQVLMIAENWFYRDDLRFAMRLLQQGEIGRIHTANFRRLKQLIPRPGEFSSTPWRWQGAYEGGPILDGGVHQIAMLRMLMGDIDTISGQVQDVNPTHGGPSQFSVNLRFTDAAIGNMMLASPSLTMPPDENGLRIYGTEGVMSINDERILVWKNDLTHRHVVERVDPGYTHEFRNFYEAVVHGAPVVGDYLQSWRGMEFIHLALESATQQSVLATDREIAPLSRWPIDLWLPHGETTFHVNVETTTVDGFVVG